MTKPTVERLRELFDYDPETGLLLWKIPRPHIRRGDEAGGLNSRGAHMVSVDGRRIAATQIIWALANGEYPGYRLRTKNGDPEDLRLDNLTRYKERNSPDYDDTDHRAVKAIYLRQVNTDAMKNLQSDNRAWEDYCRATPAEQRRILATYRQELRDRYPTVYPSAHLKRPGRPHKSI